ncbi:MAG: hypothetical protein JKY55_04535 [Aliivibrio sp.]|uniref:hypothetical protein n=1 Tax=Aliivibrio sp. TaxID=1872443 RepID=UPI001A4453D7|nr:hypothetical protein [Aliivibrio sp.]
MINIALYCGGGLGVEVLSYISDIRKLDGAINEVVLVDEMSPRMEDLLQIDKNISHYKSLVELPKDKKYKVVIAVGDPQLRQKKLKITDDLGFELISIIHPTAYVASTAKIEEGAIIAPFAFVGPFALLSRNVVLNTYASVGHDSKVGQSSVLSPYAALNGLASIGVACFLGSKSVVSPRIEMGGNSKLSAGSVLNQDTDRGALAHGNPAKWRVMFRPE